VVLPAHDGQVIIVKLHKFMFTSILFKLNLLAFLIFTHLFDGLWLNFTDTFFSQLIYFAVSVFDFKKSSYGPLNVTSQPKSHAHGQISITRSDAFINSSLCSTTTIVFHISLSFFIELIAFTISL
jgi:hypothetical protein